MSGKQVWMAIALSVVTATSGVTAAFDTKPDPLLALDMHRTAVIDRVVASFKEQMTADQEQRVRDTLYWMRADQLLAASLASSLDGLISVLESVDKSTPSKGARTKSAGDIDLAYTPITPCRIVDTRAGTSGRLIGGVEKTFAGYNSVSFATQGGSSSTCGIPIGAKALAMTVTAVRPDNLGFIKIWAANSSEPNASTINYDPGTTNIATGAIVPVDGANQNGFKAKSPAGVDLVVDVVGYFNAMKTAAPIDPAQLPLAYFDANDRPIGPWAKNASTDCSNTISCDLAIFRRPGVLFPLRVTQMYPGSSSWLFVEDVLYFELSACAGTPVVVSRNDLGLGAMGFAVSQNFNGNLLLYVATGIESSRTVYSARFNGVCISQVAQVTGAAATVVEDLTARFAQPLQLK